MSYKKKGYYYSKKKKWTAPNAKYGYFGKAGTDAYHALNMARKALSLINTEYKYRDNASSSQAGNIDSEAIKALMNGYPRATTSDQDRVGNSAKITSIQLRAFININVTSPPTNTFVRLMIVLDKQPNGVEFDLSDLLKQETLQSFRNLTNGKRFLVYMDKMVNISTERPQQFVKFHKDVDIHTEYNDNNDGSITNINTNAIYFVAFSNIALASPDLRPIVTYKTRTRFIDN